MMDYRPLLEALATTTARSWLKTLPSDLAVALSPNVHGQLPTWLKTLDALPDVQTEHIKLHQSCIQIGDSEELEHTQRTSLIEALQSLTPWRKGPYDLFGIPIDSEWRSDWKWERLEQHIQALNKRLVLDVGCGSGYHCWRMTGAGATRVIGIDPGLLFVVQFHALKHFAPHLPVDVLPLALEQLPANLQAFDTVFSMGVLYHRRSPIDHLLQLRDCLRPGGELILETLIIEGESAEVLTPRDRYAKMRNVWFIPSLATLERWLERCGFQQIRCIDVTTTSTKEQRQTKWSADASLSEFLSPDNPSLTIEGYPAPLRATLIAERGCQKKAQ
ncbi:MAG: tRNA 5-methoxyuridine(34)/uridine 5-oxyacetic acid(34) synthase CmoB [Thiothrix sp.]|nr:MAG: tRNA 5-methoxyuridine(34)/uridine 5-oxyacetic acid(34) synthase CmoB [Thiothrix sp.]